MVCSELPYIPRFYGIFDPEIVSNDINIPDSFRKVSTIKFYNALQGHVFDIVSVIASNASFKTL
jgi:hypothetical protein